jgi:hypothetical protein
MEALTECIPKKMGATIGKATNPNSTNAVSQAVPFTNFEGKCSSGQISSRILE